MGVLLYTGISDTKWNRHPVEPGAYACVSPVKGASVRTHMESRVSIPPVVKVIQDSGAFSDSWNKRLTFDAALERQIKHAAKYRYSDQIEYRVSYDWLIDEVWDENGDRTKRRWSVESAEQAVRETIAAAQFLSEHHNGLNLILSAQGVDATQYLDCVKAIIPFMRLEQDALGLGGWCIIGKMPKQMMKVFRDTVRLIIPYAASQGIKRVHIFGVIYPEALGSLAWYCDQYGLILSTDSTSPQLNPITGNWGYGNWRDNTYQRVGVETRGLERARHVQLTINWLANIEETIYYKDFDTADPKRGKHGYIGHQQRMF